MYEKGKKMFKRGKNCKLAKGEKIGMTDKDHKTEIEEASHGEQYVNI